MPQLGHEHPHMRPDCLCDLLGGNILRYTDQGDRVSFSWPGRESTFRRRYTRIPISYRSRPLTMPLAFPKSIRPGNFSLSAFMQRPMSLRPSAPTSSMT